jgi:hypothetical protein
MAGRRKHRRYVVPNLKATLRVVTDVTVQHDGRGSLTAISDQPRPCMEELSIELIGPNHVTIPVRVAGSCPIVEDGSIRHLLRLIALDQSSGSGASRDDSA